MCRSTKLNGAGCADTGGATPRTASRPATEPSSPASRFMPVNGIAGRPDMARRRRNRSFGAGRHYPGPILSEGSLVYVKEKQPCLEK